MKRLAHAQSGLTLMELLIALAIAALLVAPLAAAVGNALRAQSVASEANDVAQQARFAMRRMEAAVRNTAPHALAAKAADTSGDWLAPVAFCRNNGQKMLRETTPSDVACNSGASSVIADNVSAFSVQSFNAGAGAGQVIELRLVLTGATGQSIDLTSRTRLGGGTL